MASPSASRLELSAAEIVGALHETRQRTLELVEAIDDRDLERVFTTLMSPLVWDLGHIAAFEDLWLVHRYGGRPLLHDQLMDVYDAFETPRAGRGDLPFLRPAQARAYLDAVRERTLEVISERGVGDGLYHELVIRHEQQHGETMLQAIALARLRDYALPSSMRGVVQRDHPRTGNPNLTGLEFVEVPAGPFWLGAEAEGFAYDNERPHHRGDTREFLLGRAPVTNASYLHFVEGGGYERREWWSDEGWAWKEEYDITRPAGWTEDLEAQWRVDGRHELHPDEPVIHVSWFEADAFARAHDARLPTEAEWEKAATWDQETGESRPMPWGSEELVPGRHANVDRIATGPLPVNTSAAGASPVGCLGMIGDTWEWTASPFTGYPGFRAYPYREYSEVFFGDEYRVLRGGSWATRARVAGPTFRNWDYPQRRQIFSGLRLAREV